MDFKKWEPGMPLITESGTNGVVAAYFGWIDVASQIMAMQASAVFYNKVQS